MPGCPGASMPRCLNVLLPSCLDVPLTQCLHAPMPQCPGASMFCCPGAPMSRCLSASMPGCLDVLLPCCQGASMPRCLDVPLPGCLGAWVPRCRASCSCREAGRPPGPCSSVPFLERNSASPLTGTTLPGGAPPNRLSRWCLRGFGSSPVVSLPLPLSVSLVILTLCAFLSLLPSWDSGGRPQSPPPGFSSTLTSSRSPSAQVPSTRGSS